jgi:hypothetical protein
LERRLAANPADDVVVCLEDSIAVLDDGVCNVCGNIRTYQLPVERASLQEYPRNLTTLIGNFVADGSPTIGIRTSQKACSNSNELVEIDTHSCNS